MAAGRPLIAAAIASWPALRDRAAQIAYQEGAVETATELVARGRATARSLALREQIRDLRMGDLGEPVCTKPIGLIRRAKPATVGVVVSAPLLARPGGYRRRTEGVVGILKNLGVPCLIFAAEAAPTARSALPAELFGVEVTRLRSDTAVSLYPEKAIISGLAERLAEVGRRREIGAFVAASNYMNGLSAAIAAERIGAGVIYEMRGLWHLSSLVERPWLRGTEVMAYWDRRERAAVRSADAVVCLSPPLADWAVSAGARPERVHVVPNGASAPPPATAADRIALRESLGLQADAKVLGYIGSLVAYEGLPTLLDAARRVLSRDRAAALMVVGDGPLRSDLQRSVRRWPRDLAARVVFTGAVSPDRAHLYIAAMDVGTLPRSSHEVTRLVPPVRPAEYWAAGVPLVLSELPALTWLGQNGRHWIAVPPDDAGALADAVARLLAEPERCQALALAALDLFRRELHWDALSPRYANALECAGVRGVA
jgi:glycosyltransferase involved in cell wall biosynthesis